MRSQSKQAIVVVTETAPNGAKTDFYTGLVEFIKDENALVAAMVPIPTPGPHCESWYGQPCQFLGNGCPRGAFLPALLDGQVQCEGQLTASEILKRMADEPDFIVTKEMAEWAFAGLVQLEGFLKRLRARIEKESRRIGPIALGDTKYGWFITTENEVDKAFALKEMLQELTVEEIAKVISIGKSNIDRKISKKAHGELRETLLGLAVSIKKTRPTFGPIKEG